MKISTITLEEIDKAIAVKYRRKTKDEDKIADNDNVTNKSACDVKEGGGKSGQSAFVIEYNKKADELNVAKINTSKMSQFINGKAELAKDQVYLIMEMLGLDIKELDIFIFDKGCIFFDAGSQERQHFTKIRLLKSRRKFCSVSFTPNYLTKLHPEITSVLVEKASSNGFDVDIYFLNPYAKCLEESKALYSKIYTRNVHPSEEELLDNVIDLIYKFKNNNGKLFEGVRLIGFDMLLTSFYDLYDDEYLSVFPSGLEHFHVASPLFGFKKESKMFNWFESELAHFKKMTMTNDSNVVVLDSKSDLDLTNVFELLKCKSRK